MRAQNFRLAFLVASLMGVGCGGSAGIAQDGLADSGLADGSAADIGAADIGADVTTSDGGCAGRAPNCFGSDLQTCCGHDPSGLATCRSGNWMCGEAGAPGCNGTACGSSNDAGISPNDSGLAACVGSAPNCFGSDSQSCCGKDPSGVAVCQSGKWMCGASGAPGCNQTSCLALDGGGAPQCMPPCAAGDVCVSNQTVGGAQFFPDDAGNCPQGMIVVGSHCARSPTYMCAKSPAACGQSLSCSCASALCTANSKCVKTSPGEVYCVFAAP